MSRIGLRWCLTRQSLEGVRALAGSADRVLLFAPSQSILGVTTSDCVDDGGVAVDETPSGMRAYWVCGTSSSAFSGPARLRRIALKQIGQLGRQIVASSELGHW